MVSKSESSVATFLKGMREADPPWQPQGLGGLESPLASAPTRPAVPATAPDPAGELLKVLQAGPLAPSEVAGRLSLTVTEALGVLHQLEHFGLVEIATDGAQKLVKLTGS